MTGKQVAEENKDPDLSHHLFQPFRVIIQIVEQQREPYYVRGFSYHYLDLNVGFSYHYPWNEYIRR
jgi:hypothetical protein